MYTFRQLRWFFRRYWKRYTLAVLILLLINVLMLLPPRLIGDVVDQMRTGTLSGAKLTETVALLLGLGVLFYVLRFLWRHLLFGGSLTLEKLLRLRYFTHLTRMTPAFFQRRRTGDVMAVATNDIPAIELMAGEGVLALVDALFMTLLALTTMLVTIDWRLTVAALVPMPFLAWSTAFYGRLLHERFYRAQEAFGRMNDHVQEALAGLRVLRAYVQEEQDAAAFRQVSEQALRRNVDVAKVDALFDPTISIIINFSFLISLGYGSYLVMTSEISLGDLVAFNLYLGLLIWPMFAFGFLVNIVQRGSAALKRLQEIFAEEPEVQEAADALAVAKPGDIEAVGLNFRYPGSDQLALADISFLLRQGQTLGIVGRTGSGKSTLCRLLLHQYPLPKQSLFLSGQPIERYPLAELRRLIAYVPQEHQLFSRTIRENVAFGRPEAEEQEILNALQLAALTDDLSRFPAGLMTMVGEKGVTLSGGQKQRLAIARALLVDADVLILDDALSAVDARTEEKILRHLRRERAGKTTLIAAHRLSAVQHADLILVLDKGRIVERGTHDQLMAANGWYAQQYRRQQLEQLIAHDEGGSGR